MEDLRKLLAAGKLVLGSEETLKLLRKGKVQRVLLSANCSPEVKADVERLCSLANIQCVVLEQKSDEIGALCRKPFAISVIAVI